MNNSLYYQQYLLKKAQEEAETKKGQYLTDSLKDKLKSKAQNYFRGQVKNNLGNVANKAGEYLANKTGFLGKVGNALTNAAAKNAAANLAGNIAGNAATNIAANTAGNVAANALAQGGAAAATGAAGTAAANAAGGATGALAGAGPIGWLATLGVMAVQGANRKRAKKAGEALLNQTNEMSKQSAQNRLSQAKSNTAGLMEASQDVTSTGQGTIGTSTPFVTSQNPIEDYQNYLRGQNKYSEDVINGVSQGLNSGYPEISNWINDYNASDMGQISPINIPKTDEEIALARQGNFNVPKLQGGVGSGEINEEEKNGIINSIINGVTDFSKGFNENRANAFAPQNLTPDENKGFMTRAGEAAGTLARTVQRPGVQGLIAGTLGGALTGNPLYGVGLGYNMANARQMSDIREKALRDEGINVDAGTFGNITSQDMETLLKPKYKQIENEISRNKILEDLIYHQNLNDIRANELESLNNYRNQQIGLEKERLLNQRTQDASQKAYRDKMLQLRREELNNKTKEVKSKPKEDNGKTREFNKDLATFYKMMDDPDYPEEERNKAKYIMIEEYGINPEELYLKGIR